MGIKEDIELIKNKVITEPEEPKKKKFRLPFTGKVGKAKAKKNWVGILKLNENGTIKATKQQIEEQTVMVDGVPRLGSSEYLFRWKKYPIMIIPSWSVNPLKPTQLNPTELYQQSLVDGSNTAGYKLLLARMKSEVVDSKHGSLGWVKWVLGAVVVGIIVYIIGWGG